MHFRDIITDCIQSRCNAPHGMSDQARHSLRPLGQSTNEACEECSGEPWRAWDVVEKTHVACRQCKAPNVELSLKTRVCKVFRVCNNVKTLKCTGAAVALASIMRPRSAQERQLCQRRHNRCVYRPCSWRRWPILASQPAIHRRISREKQACAAGEADHATLASNASRFYKLHFFA